MTNEQPIQSDSSSTNENQDDADSVSVAVSIIPITAPFEGFRFEFGPGHKFDTAGLFFHTLRDALSGYLDGKFLMVRYASRISCMNYPVIADPQDWRAYFDPYMVVRDPLMHVERTGRIELMSVPSKPFFYRKKTTSSEFKALNDRSDKDSGKRHILIPVARGNNDHE